MVNPLQTAETGGREDREQTHRLAPPARGRARTPYTRRRRLACIARPHSSAPGARVSCRNLSYTSLWRAVPRQGDKTRDGD